MISRASEYAIRALTYLASQPPGSFHLARDMGEKLQIPAPFLAKILQPLVARGLVHSQRGRSGGFRLAKEASQINLYEIVDAEEHLGRLGQCMLGQAECSDERACPLHEYWSATCDHYLGILSTTTIESLARFGSERPDCHYPLPGVFSTDKEGPDSLGGTAAHA
ncbi:MAG: Rrf2 family transcriptional regulator [Planctomycetota bacterium]